LENKKASGLWECNRSFHVINYLPKLVIEWLGVRVRVCVCVHVYICACVCVCMYIYACVCVYIYIYIHTYIHTHIHIPDCIQTVYELPLLPNDTAVKHFYTNRSGAKC